MAFNLTFWAISALLIGLAGWLLAALVYRSGPTRPVNRALAFLLVCEGANVATVGGILVSASAADAHAWTYVHAWADMLVIAAYLIFIGQALRTRLVAPLRSRWVQGGVVAGLGAGTVLLLVFPSNFTPGIFAFPIPSFTLWVTGIGPWWPGVWIAMTGVFAYGFVAAVHAWRTAPAGPTRRRARAYVAAFGVRDVGWAVVFTSHVIVGTTDPAWFAFILELQVFTTLAYLLLLGYGLLKTQLFDFELKVKWGIEKSTIAAAFGAVFVVVSEGIEVLLGVEGTLYGVVAAVAIGVFFQRLEGLAEGLTDRLMPGVEDTEEYRKRRRSEVYEGTLRELLEDGEITDRDRIVLDRLRDELELGDEDAKELERDVRDDLGVAA